MSERNVERGFGSLVHATLSVFWDHVTVGSNDTRASKLLQISFDLKAIGARIRSD